MAMTAPRSWIIAYDIRDPNRLAHVHKSITSSAIAVQYSVFWFEGSMAQLASLFAELRDVVDLGEDDIRAYQIPPSPEVVVLGRASFPSGMHILPSRAEGGHGILRRTVD